MQDPDCYLGFGQEPMGRDRGREDKDYELCGNEVMCFGNV